MFLLSLYSSAPLASFVFVCSLCSLYVPCFLHVRSLYSASMSVSFLPGARRSRSRNRRAARPAPSSDSQLLSWKLLSQRRAAPSSRIPLPGPCPGNRGYMAHGRAITEAEVSPPAHHTETSPINNAVRAPRKNVVQKELSPNDARCLRRSRSTFPNPSAADARMRRLISSASVVGYLPGSFVDERLASPVACNFKVFRF